ncbi:MAG: ribonuclease HI [Bifidobacteriaceae bacterium]|jgi:ribonuclease HI|nr:ribonuclease HI [Bifidobacteriaceae bacterium]
MKIVSTDGSSLSNPGSIGWAWADRNGNFGVGGNFKGTNQIAELSALLEALRSFRNTKDLLIESDSQYAINCASIWLKKWRINGWKGSNKKQISNINLIQAINLEMLARQDRVEFKWVKGHSGDEYNEKVDKLANQAARKWQAGESFGTMPPEAYNDINKNNNQNNLFNQSSLF